MAPISFGPAVHRYCAAHNVDIYEGDDATAHKSCQVVDKHPEKFSCMDCLFALSHGTAEVV